MRKWKVFMVAAVLSAAPAAVFGLQQACWAGHYGAGPSLRRVLFESNESGDGQLHVMSRAISTASLRRLSIDGDTTRFVIIAGTDTSRLNAHVWPDSIIGTWQRPNGAVPVRLTRALSEAPARALLGVWNGTIAMAGIPSIRFGMRFMEVACGQVHVTIDSPDQRQENLPATDVRITPRGIDIDLAYLDARVSAEVDHAAGTIRGRFVQGDAELILELARADSAVSMRRPQEPTRPYPYEEQEVTYVNGDVRLAGTLTLPSGAHRVPAVLLVTGSGYQDRNETVNGHRPFLVIADYLTRRGIGVLRVDDRGVGGSTGDVITSSIPDYATDVLAGVQYLKTHPRVDASRIGLLGHSEGGYTAPLAAASSNDVAFLVLLAAPGFDGVELMIQQDSALTAAYESDSDFATARRVNERLYVTIRDAPDTVGIRDRVRDALSAVLDSLSEGSRAMIVRDFGSDPASAIAMWMRNVLTPWFRSLLEADPQTLLRALRIPVLAITGDLDVQVPALPNLAAIEAALSEGGNACAVVELMPGLNHLLQRATTGRIEEYSQIEETISPLVLERIGDFISGRVPCPQR